MRKFALLVIMAGMTEFAVVAETPASPVNKSNGAKTQPPLEAKDAAALAAKLKDSINLPPEQLAKEAQRLVREVQVELEFGKPITVLETHIQLLEEFRLECTARAEQATKERKSTATELQDELARVKAQYKEMPEIAESAQVNLIVTYRTSLRSFKEEEDHCRKLVADTDRQLTALRLRKATLVEKRKLGLKGVLTDRELALPSLPSLGVAGKTDVELGKSKESLQEALDSIKDLTK